MSNAMRNIRNSKLFGKRLFQPWKVYLNAVRAEGLDVAVIDEIDSPQVDDAQVGSGGFHFMNVNHFVNFLFFLADFLISTF